MSVQIEVTTDTEAIDVTTGNVTSVNITDPSGYSQEDIEDIQAALIEAGESIRKQYDDVNNTLTIGLSGTISGGDSTQW